MTAFEQARVGVGPPDAEAMHAGRARQASLTKPPGSFGRLEDLGVQLCGIAGTCPPPVATRPAVAVFAADHGVVAQHVTPWPQDVTAAMVAAFAGGRAAINAVARQVGASVTVVDVGVAADVAHLTAVVAAKVRHGTADMTREPAMSEDEARRALDVGADTAQLLVSRGADLLVTGDMGIGNTTASAALIAAFTGAPPATVTGRGTGIDDAMLAHKVDVVARALDRHAALVARSPIGALQAVGGLEIAALAGLIVSGARARVPVVLDGVISCAAALAAEALAPGAARYCVAGHLSTEPGAAVAVSHLDLSPLLSLDMRLGEGTGACLAVPLVQTAARVLGEMATFDEAGIARA